MRVYCCTCGFDLEHDYKYCNRCGSPNPTGTAETVPNERRQNFSLSATSSEMLQLHPNWKHLPPTFLASLATALKEDVRISDFILLNEHSSDLRTKIQVWAHAAPEFSLGQIAVTLCNFGNYFAERGSELDIAKRAYNFAIRLKPNYPITLAAMAKLLVVEKDRAAAQFAKSYLSFTPRHTSSDPWERALVETWNSAEAKNLLALEADAMRQIIHVCDLNPQWPNPLGQ